MRPRKRVVALRPLVDTTLKPYGQPTVSVITLFHERRDLARKYLDSWRASRGPERVDLFFGDSASADGTADLVASARDLAAVTRFSHNLGFAAGNNALARQARGEILLFLNYDVVLVERWLEVLVDSFSGRDDLGIIGNVQISVRSRETDHAGVFFHPTGYPFHFRPPLASVGRVPLLPVPAVTGACLAIRRRLFEDLGGFDEAYCNGFEDIDLCVRARQCGTEIAVATRSMIWHYIGSSPGRQSAHDANADRFETLRGSAARALSRFHPPVLRNPAGPAFKHPALAEHETLQVFHPAPGGFSEQASTVHLLRRRRWSRVEIPLSAAALGPGATIRLDPGSGRGRIQIGGIGLKHGVGATRLWHVRGAGLGEVFDVAGTARRLDSDRGFVLESTGNDPQILVHLPPGLTPPPGGLVLDAWLFVKPADDEASPPRSKPVWKRSWRDAWRPRKVLVDLWRLQPGGLNGGIKATMLTLLGHLARHHRRSFQLVIVVNPAVRRELGDSLVPCRVLALDALAYEAGAIPSEARGLDLIYAPLGFSRLSRDHVPQASMIVDLLHRDLPNLLPAEETAFRERWVAESIAQSAVIQCDSEFVAGRLRHHYGVEPGTIHVIYNSIAERLDFSQAGTGNDIPDELYFIYPANDWPHKNHARLLEAFARYRAETIAPWKLHLTGHFERRSELQGQLERLGLVESVVVHSFLSEDRYADLVRRAGALFFPSLYEGFGIPVIEAFAAGVPVACSRTGSLPEVADNACLFFEPRNLEEMAGALRRISVDTELRKRLQRAGRKRASAFRLSREVKRLARMLRAAAERPARGPGL